MVSVSLLPPQNDIYAQGCFLSASTTDFERIESGGATISADLPKGRSGKALKLDYSVSNDAHNYSGWQVLLGDANNGIDLSAYTTLKFWMRGESGRETPNAWLMMPIIGGKYNRYYKRIGLTTSWKEYSIPLTHFTTGTNEGEKVDLRNIQRIQFMFEWYSAPASGTVYIDDLCIE